MKKTGFLFLQSLIVSFMISCTQKEKADLIITNAKIYTVDSLFSTAESMVIKNGKLIKTGKNEEILNKYRADKMIDATGKFIYPGFNDAHCHFNGYGTNLIQYADLRGTKSTDEIYSILKNHHEVFGGDWILGRSWDQNDWEIKEFPDKEKLDELFPGIPVYLVRVDGHAGWCNSKAMELAGITAGSKVQGGEVVLKNGQPSGILIDNAMGLINGVIPEVSREQQIKGLLAAQTNCFAAGLTSVTDCGLNRETVLLMEELQSSGGLKIRINAMLNPTDENIETFVKHGPKISGKLVINSIKTFADGALGSRGALLLSDYSDDPGNRGLQIAGQEFYDKICQIALDNHFIMATHAIGDSANRLVLNTYGKFLKGKNDRRWRIEHAQIVNPGDFAKFAEFSIVPSIQATHCTSDMEWAKNRVGEERIKGAYAYQTLLGQNGWLPNGTDFPVESIEPIFTFYSSVFRTDHNAKPQGGWQIEEGLSREQALRSMTIWAAKSSFEEEKKGSLEPGKYADFIILDTDLLVASPEEVLKAKVESTWLDGERVFGL